jgi:hypothetical protein
MAKIIGAHVDTWIAEVTKSTAEHYDAMTQSCLLATRNRPPSRLELLWEQLTNRTGVQPCPVGKERRIDA